MGHFRSPVMGTHIMERWRLTKFMHKTRTWQRAATVTSQDIHLLLLHSTLYLFKNPLRVPFFVCLLVFSCLFCPVPAALLLWLFQRTLLKIAGWLQQSSPSLCLLEQHVCRPERVLHQLSDWACWHKRAVIPCLKDCYWHGPFNLSCSKLQGPSSLQIFTPILTSLSIPLYFLRS